MRYQNFSIEFKNGECRGKVACTSDHNLIVLEFYKEIRIYNRKEKNESVAFQSEENKELFGVFGISRMEISKDDKMLYLLGDIVEVNKDHIQTLMVYSFETKQKKVLAKINLGPSSKPEKLLFLPHLKFITYLPPQFSDEKMLKIYNLENEKFYQETLCNNSSLFI